MSTVKINWGAKIALLYGGFVTLIVILVVGSMRQDFDLVAPDYYGQEIKYQEVIDAGKNQSQLSAPVVLKTSASEVRIEFPIEFSDVALKGTVQFYSPVNASWDKNIDIKTIGNSVSISKAELKKTSYKVKISWEAAGKAYYQESEINLY